MKLLILRIVALILLAVQSLELGATVYPISQRQAAHAATPSVKKRKYVPRRLRRKKIKQNRRKMMRSKRRRKVTLQTEYRVLENGPFSYMYPKFFIDDEPTVDAATGNTSYLWERGGAPETGVEEPMEPFNEVTVTFNAKRPEEGKFIFLISVKESGQWSPLAKFAEWTSDSQRTFAYTRHPSVRVLHNKTDIIRGRFGTGVRVKVVAEDGANISDVHAIFVNTCNLNKFGKPATYCSQPTCKVAGIKTTISQRKLDHACALNCCMPAALYTIVNFHAEKSGEPRKDSFHDDMLDFVLLSYDDALGIYGCWPLPIAQAYHKSDGNLFCRAQRLNSFDDICHYIRHGIPVAVSVRSLPGGALPYANGHYIVVYGFDKEKQVVHCIDPAFLGGRKRSDSMFRDYKFEDFSQAWGRSRNMSNIPMPRNGMFASQELWKDCIF